MRAVLVTGANTPVGTALVDALRTDPSVAHVLAVAAQEAPHGLSHGDKVAYARVDLARPREVRELLYGPVRAVGIDAIVHTALHRGARDEGRRMHRLNVESTRELLALAEGHPTVRRFVYRSYAEVYCVEHARPTIVGEDHPLAFASRVQRVRDRIEADVTVCTRMGVAPLHVVVLRCAEIFAASSGSELWDFLDAPVCFRPLGYDPMIEVLSVDDAVHAMELALRTPAQGVFNVPGADVLPLSAAIAAARRPSLAVPGPLLAPLYGLRARVGAGAFRYDLNDARFHASAILDGTRAAEVLGYTPRTRVAFDVRAPRAARAAA